MKFIDKGEHSDSLKKGQSSLMGHECRHSIRIQLIKRLKLFWKIIWGPAGGEIFEKCDTIFHYELLKMAFAVKFTTFKKIKR